MAWRQAAIAGVGATRQGKLPGETPLSLAAEAFRLALADSGIAKHEVDGLLTMPGTTSPEGSKNYLNVGELLGIDPRFTGSMTMGGATGGALVQIAAMAIATGMAKTVACIFADTARTGGSRFSAAAGGDDSWGVWGMFGNAANSAMGFRRHMALYGSRSDHLGWIAVTCRRHASMNPNAVMRDPITIDDHQNSRLDRRSAAAARLLPDQRRRGLRDRDLARARARLRQTPGVDLGHGPGPHHRQSAGARLVVPAAPAALRRRRLPHGRAFRPPTSTWRSSTTTSPSRCCSGWSMRGFCRLGEAGPFVEGGTRIGLGGELPINTAGGNLSESYMQGWLHIVEGVRQLRGECGERQVADAELCLVTGRGMTLNTASCLILGH